GNTLWGRVRWTPQGAEDVATGAYRYLSPVFTYSETTGEIVRLDGAGLTHAPNLAMTALNRAGGLSLTTETPVMSLSRLCAALGLVDGANEDQILAAVA